MANSTTNIDTIAQSQASKEVTANAFFDAASQATTYGRRASTSSGLTWGYYGGNVTRSDGTLVQVANGTLSLTANQTNYIVAAKATGAVSVSTATTNWNDTANYWRLYSVVAGAATVTSWTDLREMGRIAGGHAEMAAHLAAADPHAQYLTAAEGAAAYQPLDATLTAMASVTTAADKLIYASGMDTFAVTDLTEFGRSLIDDADAAAARTTLGLGSMATQAAGAVAITGGAINGTTIGAATPGTGAFTTLSAAGDVTFSGLGQRVRGDFSNATLNNRVFFQTSTLNGNTAIEIIPNGTNPNTRITCYSNSDPTNAPFLQYGHDGSNSLLFSGARGTGTPTRFVLQVGGLNPLIAETSGHITPGADNTQNFGSGALRWKEIFAGNGTINTSDAREKTPVRAFSAAEMAVAKGLAAEIGVFQWLAAVESKGAEAREHIGMTVQRAMEIMQAHGLDPLRYGFICHDVWSEETVEEEAGADDPAAIARIEERQATEMVPNTRHDIQVIDGVPTLVTVTEEVETPLFREMQVFDQSGQPVMIDGRPLLHKVPVMTTVTRYYKTVVRVAAGERYGFRMDQLLAFIARGFEARIAALEAA